MRKKREKEKEREKEAEMLNFENQKVEFKQEYVTDIRKEVIAFANAEGGSIFIGIRKDGMVIGVEEPDDVMQKTANSLHDAIAPDIMPFVKIYTIEMEGKRVVEIDVSTGTNRPYYIREKGLKPTGVYVRKGSSSQPVTDEGIREMILQSSGKSYEAGRSINQELTFEILAKEMERRGIVFGEPQMKTLALIGEDGLYTNLAYLLSDQCEVTTKVALFQGEDKEIFRDRREFSGSVLKQLEDVYQFIDWGNKTKAIFSGLERIDVRDYPEEAVREAWLNCCVHRDYSFSGSTIINIYENRMEFVSLGGLVPGLELKSIFLGVSQSRNPNLAAVFYRMKLIESYGTGIGKIQRIYAEAEEKPAFETAKGVFRVTLPNRNEKRLDKIFMVDSLIPVVEESISVYEKEKLSLPQQKQRILEYAAKYGRISRKETEELLDAGSTKAFRLLKELCEEGKLKSQGKGRKSLYVLPR